MRKNNTGFFAAAFLIAAAAAFLLTSCAFSSGTDLSRTVFVSSMGISLKKDIYSVTLFGNAASENGETPVSASGTGRTFAEAVAAARHESGMELFLGHCERIAADSAALRDSAMLTSFTDSVVSPACRIYFSSSPEKGAENIASDGFSSELYRLSVCARNGSPAVIPTAEDPNRAAVITADGTFLLDSEDSFGLMLLRDEAPPRMITAAVGGSFETVKISPSAKRRAYISGGVPIVDIRISLNAENCSLRAERAVAELSSLICRRVFEKTVNTMGVDSVNLCELTDYTAPQLKEAVLHLVIE